MKLQKQTLSVVVKTFCLLVALIFMLAYNGKAQTASNQPASAKENPEIEKLFKDLKADNQLDLINKKYEKGVPDAPFKKTWPDLVIKRMVREAAENGYDKLSWTP